LPQGFDTVVGERGVTLSGGQRQRVALARALVRNPRLLILDDATSAVDPVVEQEILRGRRQEIHTTLVVVAYRVSTIALADRVLLLMDGKVAADGTHEELLSHPAYRAMLRAFDDADSLVRTGGSRTAAWWWPAITAWPRFGFGDSRTSTRCPWPSRPPGGGGRSCRG